MIDGIDYIESVKIQGSGYLLNGNMSVPKVDGNRQYEDIKEFISNSGTVEPEFTNEELLQQIEDAKPKVVTMRQARLALLQSGLLATVETAIFNSADDTLKIEWEYATEIKRDWASLNTLATALSITDEQLDNLFILADTL